MAAADETGASTAYNLLFAAIEEGRLAAGTRLQESRLAQEYDLGRTPIRDALKRLEAEGLITHEPHRGAVVTKLNYAQAVEIYSLREVLEGVSAAFAALHATDAEIEFLRELVGNDRKLIGNAEQLRRHNRLFHTQLSFCARNEVLGPMISALRTTIAVLPGNNLHSPERQRQSIDEHCNIVDCIARRDAAGAEAAARSHIRNSLKSYIRGNVHSATQYDGRAGTAPDFSSLYATNSSITNRRGAGSVPSSALLAEKAYRALRQSIFDKELLPGSRLVERDIAELLDLSRTPVREALRRLEAEGLVQSTRPKGYVITKLDSRKARDIYAVREVLEGTAARLAAESASPAELELLQELVAQEATAVGNVTAMARVNRKLHNVISESANNRYLQRTLKSLWDVTILLGPAAPGNVKRPKFAHSEHGAIVEAIVGRDPIKAEAAARTHVAMAFRARLPMHAEESDA